MSCQPKIHAFILGENPLKDLCVFYANGISRIYFMRFVSDVEPYYTAADIYISASKSEGLPNSVIEATGYQTKSFISDILRTENWLQFLQDLSLCCHLHVKKGANE